MRRTKQKQRVPLWDLAHLFANRTSNSFTDPDYEMRGGLVMEKIFDLDVQISQVNGELDYIETAVGSCAFVCDEF